MTHVLQDVTLLSEMLVPIAYMLPRRGRTLVKPLTAPSTVKVFAAFALAGLLIAGQHGFERAYLGLAVAMASPLAHSVLLRRSHAWFVRRYGRPVKNVSFNWRRGLIRDRVFAISFCLSCTLGSMALVGCFIWGTARSETARR